MNLHSLRNTGLVLVYAALIAPIDASGRHANGQDVASPSKESEAVPSDSRR